MPETTKTTQKPEKKNQIKTGDKHQAQQPEDTELAQRTDSPPGAPGAGRVACPRAGTLSHGGGGTHTTPPHTRAYLTSWLIWRSRRWRRSSSCSMGLSSGNSYGAVRISLSASERQNSSCPGQPCHELWPVSAPCLSFPTMEVALGLPRHPPPSLPDPTMDLDEGG